MQITVNGEPRTLTTESLSTLLADLALADKRIAVELNEEICPRSQWETIALADGDRIEIVHAIGGG